jgi:glycosyltransferase involved in cell wall biosynthesis
MFSMQTNPLVSVVIPSRNRLKSVLRCIRNVSFQTYPEIEIIVINDCSDEDYSVMQQERVRYLTTDRHGGAALARNVGLRHARGEYISFIDDDDAWLPIKLESQIAQMRREGYLFSATEGYRVTDPTNPLSSPVYHRGFHRNFLLKHLGTTVLPSEFNFEFISAHNYIITSSVVIHRSVYEHIGLFNESEQYRRGQDYEYWKRILAANINCLYIDIPFIFYRAF